MTITSGFFKSVNGDRKYQAEFFSSYFASFIGNGVYANPSTNLQVLAFQNMQTRVSIGRAWINGSYLLSDEAITITHAPSDGVMRRVDRIVVGLNLDSRAMDIYLKQGTPATNAVAPALVRNATIYELALADISIVPGSTSISQSNITDQRLNSDLCGIVSAVVQQLDTSTAFLQYEQQFNDFLESVQDALDGDTAGNLYNLIVELQNKTNYATQTQATEGSANNVIMTPSLVKSFVKQFGISDTVERPAAGPNQNVLGGIYRYGSDDVGVPSANSGFYINMVRFSSVLAQIAIDDTGNVYARARSGNFTPWIRLAGLNITGNLSDLQTINKTNLVAAINEVKLQANDIKTKVSTVVGAPLLPTDTSDQTVTKIQTIKSKLATYNTNKGQVSNNNETLDSLVEKVNLINQGPQSASGTALSSSTRDFYIPGNPSVAVNRAYINVTGLSFRPKKIYAVYRSADIFHVSEYDVSTPNLDQTLRISAYNNNSIGNITSYLFSVRDNIFNNGFYLPVALTNENFQWYAEG